MEWSVDSDRTLIGLVEQFGNIYDKSHPDFKNQIVKGNSWKSIGTIIQRSAKDCEIRWVVLRNRYAREKRAMKEESCSGAGRSVRSSWPLMNVMGFLSRYVVPRKKTTGNIPADTNLDVDIEGPSTSRDNIWGTEIVVQEEDVPITSPFGSPTTEHGVTAGTSQLASSDTPETSTPETSRQPTPGTSREQTPVIPRDRITPDIPLLEAPGIRLEEARSRKRKRGDEEQEIRQVLASISDFFKHHVSETDENADEDFVFGRQIALMLKGIRNNKRKKLLKARIMQLLAETDSDTD